METTLKSFFEKRALIEQELDKELQTHIDKLLASAPNSVKHFLHRSMQPTPTQWFGYLYTNTWDGNFNSSKVKDPVEDGFFNMSDAKLQLESLKEAWQDVIFVEIIDGSYLTVQFRLCLSEKQ